ncbi:Uncharacterised protein [Chryseobacterium carnipullorum]|uniref:Uncharacterized protein n=1 Tax=Chryseobacterium carnipullorum TaxID=1124835 RepID=A0A376DQQ0_CHRCU|nr:Uncharacterised protein [Chryseobacterium carnipullorum]
MIFVTGATGILGRVIVLELLKKGKKRTGFQKTGKQFKRCEAFF